ncbi:MAG TPA: BatA domain-containing protein [Blastocatellia bacterium]|nr:BatA domain-containing protein [Blastocatellia bacterium]
MISFLNPLFFLGALALSIPILVHLARRERAEKIPFPSLMFLQRLPQRVHKRRRLQHLLLFIIRSVAVALLFLAFARPFLSGASTDATESSTTAVIVLDTSCSMRYGDRFATALARARELVASASERKKLGLVTFSTSADVLSQPTSDRAALAAILDRVRPTHRATSLLAGLRTAAQVLAPSDSREKVIYLISDFQKSGLPPESEPFSLPSGVKLIPVDVAADEGDNVAVSEIAAQPLSYTPRYEGKLIARLSNYGRSGRSVTVSLRVNDRVAEERKVQLAAGATRAIEFTGFFLGSGPNRVSVATERDGLSEDDEFYVAIWRRDPTRVLIVQEPQRSSRRGSFYFEQALLAGENAPFQPASQDPRTVAVEEIRRAGLIVLHQVEHFSPGLLASLKGFIETGGGMIIALGSEAGQPDVQAALAELAPVSVAGVEMPQGSSYRVLSEVETTHPIFRIFQGVKSANFSLARFYGFVRLAPKEGATVLARLDDGSPAVIEARRGKGRILILAVPLDASWSNLPLTPVYVPFVRQMVAALKPESHRAFYRVGDMIPLEGASEVNPVPVKAPSGERVSRETGLSEDFRSFVASENGFYTIGRPGALDYVAVNLDANESNLTKADVGQFIARVAGQNGDAVSSPALVSGESERERAERQKLWRTLLFLALALLVSEAVLANQASRRRTGPA